MVFIIGINGCKMRKSYIQQELVRIVYDVVEVKLAGAENKYTYLMDGTGLADCFVNPSG